MDIYLITYPRSGKNWFKWYIENKTNLSIDLIPYVKNDGSDKDFIISQSDWFESQFKNIDNINNAMAIIRNPKDSLSSILTMENLQTIDFRYNQYIHYYEFILDKINNIFRFEDVVNNPSDIARYFSKINNKSFSEEGWGYEEYKQWYIQTQDQRKLITSKSNNLYNKSVSIVEGLDLSKHYDLYNKALNRSFDEGIQTTPFWL